jgi:hypothetical protein
MKLKGISSTPAAFDLIDITALKTSSSVTETKENLGSLVETGTSKSIPVLNDGLHQHPHQIGIYRLLLRKNSMQTSLTPVINYLRSGANWPYNEVGKIPRGLSSLGAYKAIGAPKHHDLFFLDQLNLWKLSLPNFNSVGTPF